MLGELLGPARDPTSCADNTHATAAAFDDRYNKLVQGTEVPDGYDANGMEGV